MELIIPFKKSDFTSNGTHLLSGKIIFELQQEWEEHYHNMFNPFFANVIEGHPLAMHRLTKYYEPDESSCYEFGMELIDGEIDIDINLKIENYSEASIVYAIGSRILMDEDGDGLPVFLIKNDKLKDDILVLRYYPDGDNDEENLPVKQPAGFDIEEA